MYRDATSTLDERDRAVGSILIGEALIASCERAQRAGEGEAEGPRAWRAIRDAHDDFPEIWRSLDRARDVLAQRGVNVTGYDELRPHVRTRLSAARGPEDDAGAMRVDPAALDDARRGADQLKLAVPGADWAAIEQRTSGLVRTPLLRRYRNRLIVGAALVPFAIAAIAWGSYLMPRPKPDPYAAMRRELAEIAEQRRARIVELQRSADRCDPPTAHELAKKLVMDGRPDDAKLFAARYIARCGDDEVVVHWAFAPRP
jgi:hypothetical protein